MPSDPKFDFLYNIPIEELGLSDKTIRIVKRTGITSVGNCVDSLERAGTLTEDARGGFLEAMDDEVKPKLEERSYWPLDKNEPDGRV